MQFIPAFLFFVVCYVDASFFWRNSLWSRSFDRLPYNVPHKLNSSKRVECFATHRPESPSEFN